METTELSTRKKEDLVRSSDGIDRLVKAFLARKLCNSKHHQP